MATSGTFTGSRSPSTGPNLVLDWSRIETDIAGNRSKIRLTLKLYSQYNINFSASKSGSLHGLGFTYTGGFSGTGTKTIATRDVWITHNSDGSKSQSFSASFNIQITYSGTWVSSLSVSGTASITAIPRASTLNNFSIYYHLQGGEGNKITLSISRASSSFTHDISLMDGSTVLQTWTDQEAPTELTVYSSAVDTLLNRMADVTTKTLTLRVQTKSGTTNIGSAVTRTAIATIHENQEPVLSNISILEYVSGLNAQFGEYVQNKSRLSLSMTASVSRGTTVRSYRIVANGTSYVTRTATTNVLKSAGTNTITFEVTDARGRKKTATRNINVIAYANPQIASLAAERATSEGILDDQGTHALVKYNMSISSVGSKNTKSFILRYRQNGTDTWASITLANANYSYNTSRVIGPLNIDKAFDVQLVVKDYFSEANYTTVIPSTFTLINFASSKRGLAFGQTYNDELGGLIQGGGGLVPYFTEWEEW